MCDDAEDPDDPAAAVDLISVAKDLCEDTAARPDLRGDGPVAGDELDADEDLLVDVTSGGTDVDKALHENATNEDLCVD